MCNAVHSCKKISNTTACDNFGHSDEVNRGANAELTVCTGLDPELHSTAQNASVQPAVFSVHKQVSMLLRLSSLIPASGHAAQTSEQHVRAWQKE